ncbi:MAG: hypothetical protein QNJ55_06430 [Xenococcus sp. MO_188.B8]|nr:hypothetical protein [Xenococcus sp. MO_188.B8]
MNSNIYASMLSDLPEIVNFAYQNNPENFYNVTEIFDEQESNLSKFLQILAIAEKLRHDQNFKNNTGIQEKFSEATNWYKFLSLESELYFANELKNLNFDVSFISDSSLEWQENNQTLPSPDLCAEKDNIKFLIEVAKIKDDDTTDNIANLIIPIIRKTKFRVNIQYCQDFSYPVTSYEERENREKLIHDFVAKFKQVITEVDTLPHDIDILGCKVEFTQSLLNHGYYACCSTEVLTNPADLIKPRIQFELERKANKRMKWKEEKKKYHI